MIAMELKLIKATNTKRERVGVRCRYYSKKYDYPHNLSEPEIFLYVAKHHLEVMYPNLTFATLVHNYTIEGYVVMALTEKDKAGLFKKGK